MASFFVSRVDTKVDAALEGTGREDLRGKAAVANAKIAYRSFQRIFSGPRWEALAAKGARVQRPLWASTSTKNPDYSDTLYVDDLIGPDTVNTMPDQTIDATRDHGNAERTVDVDVDQAVETMKEIEAAGVDVEDIVLHQLVDEGVAVVREVLPGPAGRDRAQGVASWPTPPEALRSCGTSSSGAGSSVWPPPVSSSSPSRRPRSLVARARGRRWPSTRPPTTAAWCMPGSTMPPAR